MAQLQDFDALNAHLKTYNQQHLLEYWQQLNESQRAQLTNQINEIDMAKVDTWVENYVKKETSVEIPPNFSPAPSYPPDPNTTQLKQKYQQAIEIGQNLIKQGKVAMFVVAGGQGTRLGFDGPKGNFPVSPIKNKTLFQIFAETIKAAQIKYNATCPWYIMTSPLNYQATVEIFQSNSYYGLNSKDVIIFQQGTMPNFSFDGKILLADKDKVACSPDGHGGSLKALYKSGPVDDMKRRGVEILSYWQVDNPLVKIVDPLFIGLHSMDKSQMSSKALLKGYPKEKVGNFCLVDGKVTVIEYSDLPDDVAEKTNDDGSLVFEIGSIGIHLISRDFIEQLNSGGDFSLPFHRAVKKISHIDKSGQVLKPTDPNGVKLETFIFDALPLAQNSMVLQTLRSEEFAPIKNAKGLDSPQVTKQMMTERAADWLKQANVVVPLDDKGKPDCTIDMSPLFAFNSQMLKDKAAEIKKIKPGDSIVLE